jgi:hypothetical protein
MRSLLFFPVLIILLSAGCLGYGEGYTDKAKEYTSADYTISTYQKFIDKYNSICNVGSSIDEYQLQIQDFDNRTRDQALSYSESNERSQLVSIKSGYVAQYNRLASEYNTMTMDKTKDWLKIASLPERVDSYSDGKHLTNNDQVSDKIIS